MKKTLVVRSGLWGWTVGILALGVNLTACGSERAGFAPTRDPHQLLSSVQLTNHAYNLSTVAPNNTVQLHATAYLADSTIVPGNVTFSTRDTAVSVDSTGVMTAKNVTFGGSVVVFAAFTYNGVTRHDSALVRVTNGIPAVARVAIRPQPGDSARRALVWPFIDGVYGNVSTQAFDVSGNVIPEILLSVRSSDTTIVSVDVSGFLIGKYTGRVWLYVSTFANGTTFTDSLEYTIGAPLYGGVNLNLLTPAPGEKATVSFEPGEIVIAAGGDVKWRSLSTVPVDIVFDDPTAALESVRIPSGSYDNLSGGPGNIAPFAFEPDNFAFGTAARLFTRPGRYPYHSTLANGSGVVVVQ